MAAKIKEIGDQIKAKRGRVAAIFEAKKTADGMYDLTTEERDEIKSLNDELNDLAPKLEQLQADAKAVAENAAAIKAMERVNRPGFGDLGGDGLGTDQGGAVKAFDLGKAFTGSPEYKSIKASRRWKDLGVDLDDVDLKTLFQTGAGWLPFSPRGPQVVLSAQQQPKVVDILPMSETTYPSVKWMLETTYTNNAAEAAETGTYQESAFALTEQSSSVVKIAVTLPATDEQLDDEPRARDYLNNRLTLNLKQRLDKQVLVGDGNAPNLKGLLSTSNIQTQAKSTDPVFDAIFKAMVKIQSVAFADPSAIIMHPSNWQTVRLTRTLEGLYILGNPGDVGPARLWGLPIITTTYQTLNTALVGDFANYTELIYRKGISFDVTNSHASEFITGTQRIRAQLRVALIVTRPAALCTVTGLS